MALPRVEGALGLQSRDWGLIGVAVGVEKVAQVVYQVYCHPHLFEASGA